MTDEQLNLDEIEAMCNAATGGIWEACRQQFREYKSDEAGWYIGGPIHEYETDFDPTSFIKREDAELMAQSRTIIPALVARVRALEMEVGCHYIHGAEDEDDLYRLGVIPSDDYAEQVEARKGKEWVRLTNLALGEEEE